MRSLCALLLASCATTRPAAPTPERHLPSPHLEPPLTSTAITTLSDLRALVGRRDKRDPIAVVLTWAAALGTRTDASGPGDLVPWAERAGRLHPPAEARPGDLLVFGSTLGIAIAASVGNNGDRVLEFVYLGGGVVRRGFVDASRPTVHRDRDGSIVNTFLGKSDDKHPLAGRLLAHAIR